MSSDRSSKIQADATARHYSRMTFGSDLAQVFNRERAAEDGSLVPFLVTLAALAAGFLFLYFFLWA